MKKILISIIIILAVALMAFFLWPGASKEDGSDELSPDSTLPFGSGERLDEPKGEGPATAEKILIENGLVDEHGAPVSELFRISDAPVAGAVIITRGQLSVVRYADRATGHILETILPVANAKTPLTQTKITNNTLPKIYEAHFQADGASVLLRSLKDDSDLIENLSLALTPPRATSTGLYTASATLLRGNIDDVASSGNTLFYSFKDSGSVESSGFNGSSPRTLVSTGLNALWRLEAFGNNLILYTKANSDAPGYAYRLNGGALTKLLGPLNGLTALPNSLGNRLIYSYVEGGQPRSFAKNLQSGALSEILPVTLAEKCVWSVKKAQMVICASPINGIGGNEPESWYQGKTSYSDRIWLFDTAADIAQVVIEPKSRFDLDLDVIEPKLSSNEDYLVFINKRDLSLWALKLEPF